MLHTPTSRLAKLLGLALFVSNVMAQTSPQTSPQPTPPDSPHADYPVHPVPFTAVHLADRFWSPRIETNRTVTIPFAFKQCEDNQRMFNFDRAAAVLRGQKITDTSPPGFPFDDTDPYKVIEGAAYSLAVQPDPQLDAYLDDLIAKIAAAQEPDGYLYTTRTLSPQSPHAWAGKERWVLERELSHELYNLGHLYEAAAAHYQATGKRNLLTVALKTADLLDRTFGLADATNGKQSIWPGHQITEMGLIKLYRITGQTKYLNLAKFFLDARGPDGHKGSGKQYNQSHLPVTQQRTAVGHAVRATYMYAGMADVAAITNDTSYLTAIDAIWQNVASAHLYTTGGIGSTARGEAFGPDHDLPNMSAYNETCAAIGNVYWNHRLFLLHAHAKYIDVLERSLYNGLISGVSLDGKSFFYPNPLESRGQHQRSPWFGCACCPSNICRFIASVPGYVYAVRPATPAAPAQLFVNLFAAGTAEIALSPEFTLSLTQQTNYPWDGTITLTINTPTPSEVALKLRIPGWAQNQPVPSDLYHFTDPPPPAPTLMLNGKPVPLDQDNGYATLTRQWRQGDTVELNLPMPVRRVAAHEKVFANTGRIALQRGPLVYCLEWPDHPGDHNGGKVRNILLKDSAPITPTSRPDLLGGLVTLQSTATAHALDTDGRAVTTDIPILAIPYYAWAHRGPGEMAVWLPNTPSVVRPSQPPSPATTAKVTASTVTSGTSLLSITDGVTARANGDEEVFHFWPRKGTAEWVQYNFPQARRFTQADLFFFDDTGKGECRTPQSWRLTYQNEAGHWLPVSPIFPHPTYTTTKDIWNPLTVDPITTTALRLELQLQPDFSTGILEWRVD